MFSIRLRHLARFIHSPTLQTCWSAILIIFGLFSLSSFGVRVSRNLRSIVIHIYPTANFKLACLKDLNIKVFLKITDFSLAVFDMCAVCALDVVLFRGITCFISPFTFIIYNISVRYSSFVQYFKVFSKNRDFPKLQ